MSKRTTFLVITLWALTAAAPASAGPVAAVITAVQAFAASSALAAFIVQTGVSLAMSALARALAPKPDGPRQPGIKTETTTSGGTNPATFILGKYATAGNMAAPPYSHPNSGDVPNRFLTYVLDVSDVPGVQLSRLIVGGEYVEDLEASGDPMHDFEGMLEDGKPHLFLAWYDGHQTAPDPYMLEHYGDHPDRRWQSDMVGTGVAYARLTFKYNRKLFNQLPAVRFEVLGIPLYDPRLDDTVGGTGAHRWDDPATWTPTGNLAVMAYNVLRGITLPDGRRWGGNVPAADLPLANWFAAMNECDVPVDLAGGGTEPQYHGGLEVAVGDEPAGVLEELLKGASAEVTEVGGVYKMRVGAPALPVYFLTDDDVVADQPQSLTPYPGLEGVHNAIHATHPSPAALWENRDAPPRYNAEWEAEDGGRQLVAEVDLPAVYSDTQVQRLMRAWIEDERRFRRHALTLPPDAAVLEPLDVVAWTSADEGYSAKTFEVAEITDDLVLVQQSVTLREREAGDFDWSPEQDEIAVEHPSPVVTVPADRVLAGFGLAKHAVTDGAGGARRPALLLTWSPDSVTDADVLHYEVHLADGTEVTSGAIADPTAGRFVVSGDILPVTAYRARAWLVGPLGGTPSVWRTATTDDLRLSYDDLAPTIAQEIDQAQAEAENAAGDAAAADLKAQTVRNLHDALVDGFGYGDLAAGFSSVDTTIKVTRKNLQAAMSSTNEVQTPDASNPENTNSAGEPIGQWADAVASTDVPASAPAGAKSIKVTDGAREMPGKATSAANRVIKIMSWVKSSGGYRPAIRNPGGGILASVSSDFETTPTWTYKTWFLDVPASVTGKWCPAWDMTDETVEVWFYDLRWEDVTEVDALGASVIQQSVAIADLQGNASAGYLVKAQAGGEVSLLDLIAADGSAGAVSVARLQASLILLNGTVSAELLSVGFGRNLLPNTDFSAGLDHWLLRGPSTAENAMSLRVPPASWSGQDYPTLMIYQSTGTSAGYVDLVAQPIIKADGTTARGVQIEVGKRYEARVQISTHRCTGELRIQWLNAAGDAIAYSGPVSIPTQTSDSANPNNWPAFVIRGNPPANAVRASIHVRKMDTMAGQSNSYMFVHKPQLAETVPNASENVPYDVGVSTLITGTGIVANTITADKLNAASLAVAGLAIFGGDLRSADFVSGSAGWRIDQDGSAEFNNLVVRSWVQEGAVSDGARGVLQAPATVGDGATAILIQTGPIGFDQFWHFTFNAEIRRLGKTTGYQPGSKAGPEYWLVSSRRTGLIFEYRLYDGASWGSWVRLDTISTGVGSNDAWQQVGFTEHFQGVYADAQLRLRVYESLDQETQYPSDPGIDWTQDNIRNAGLVAKALVR